MTGMRYAWTTCNIPQTSMFLSLKSFLRKFVSMHHNTCGWWWSKHRHLFWDLVIQPFWSFEVLHLFIVVKTDILHTVVVQRTISRKYVKATGWSKETVSFNFFLMELKCTKNGLTQWFFQGNLGRFWYFDVPKGPGEKKTAFQGYAKIVQIGVDHFLYFLAF